MLTQYATKVKRKIKSVVDKVSSALSVPQHKFLLEMLGATLSCNSLNLMELAHSLKESISIKDVHKRLQRNTSHKYILRHPAESIQASSFIYLDGGDLSYSQASSYEQMSPVRDGSSKNKSNKPGYLLNMISCRNGSGRVFPVYLDIFHRNKGYTSDNTETYKAISAFISVHGCKGIWTLDRGYDNKRTIDR